MVQVLSYSLISGRTSNEADKNISGASFSNSSFVEKIVSSKSVIIKSTSILSSLLISDNIVNHGFIDIESSLFKELSSKCGYVILPSVSEGIATAVITAMGRGAMIPVVSKECGVDIDNFGIEIKDLTVDAVKESLMKCENITDNDFYDLCKKSQAKAYSEYTLSSYSETMYRYLLKISK